MEVIEGYITDIEAYNEVSEDWDVNYKLLSKQDFSADIKMIYNEDFSLGREKLTGKIEQKGKTQEDFIVFVIPVKDTEFFWFDKKVNSSDLIIFPKENNFDVNLYNNYEVYIISIHKTIFHNSMDKLATDNFNKLYSGEPQNIFLSKTFSSRYINMLDYFLNTNLNNPIKNKALVKSIVSVLIEYLNNSDRKTTLINEKKKDEAVAKAVEIINNQVNKLFSIPQLCALAGVSERTLRNGFKERYKISPTNYIKAVKLNNIRKEIYLNPDRKISEIAGEYNFWHMGQFAKDFKKQFGELPSKIYKSKENTLKHKHA